MKKAIVLISIGLVVLLVVGGYLIKKGQDDTTNVEKWTKNYADSVLKAVKANQLKIDSLLIEIGKYQDTIKIIETRIPIIKNNYIQNEKIILTANDSTTLAIYLRSRAEFERHYLEGRYNP